MDQDERRAIGRERSVAQAARLTSHDALGGCVPRSGCAPVALVPVIMPAARPPIRQRS
jgi:hypothetical protein